MVGWLVGVGLVGNVGWLIGVGGQDGVEVRGGEEVRRTRVGRRPRCKRRGECAKQLVATSTENVPAASHAGLAPSYSHTSTASTAPAAPAPPLNALPSAAKPPAAAATANRRSLQPPQPPTAHVDLQRGVHPDGKTLLRRMQRLARAVAARVADDLDPIPKGVDRVRDEHDVLVPRHQVAGAGGAADDDAADAMLHLVVEEGVVRLEVKLAVGQVGGLDLGGLRVCWKGGRAGSAKQRPERESSGGGGAQAAAPASDRETAAAGAVSLPLLWRCVLLKRKLSKQVVHAAEKEQEEPRPIQKATLAAVFCAAAGAGSGCEGLLRPSAGSIFPLKRLIKLELGLRALTAVIRAVFFRLDASLDVCAAQALESSALTRGTVLRLLLVRWDAQPRRADSCMVVQ